MMERLEVSYENIWMGSWVLAGLGITEKNLCFQDWKVCTCTLNFCTINLYGSGDM